ncbi:PPOX class F420-dependent oxidoreductase [Micromonospora sp. NBC_01796]|uniref:PPOX class F420-dependent oxidoreductase n=1 Tax=Micromonospora sp. NBC_01796 TaxID=2975987 RepID=UPI002DDB1CC6|nr:PPOX class F420-dependent oxidoreductase [Micromonospora sp. NBC_01796]WSA87580.1 PPOX class F420-dependent oxidoreductase [Micromonospora sp. NBC_01796]
MTRAATPRPAPHPEDVLAPFARTRYVNVTTFRRDGRPVPTPVGVVVDGGEVFVLTGRDSGKVKRIRNNPLVTLVPCDMNGRIAAGAAPVEGRARLLDPAGTARVRRLMSRRYPIARIAFAWDLLLRRRAHRIGIAIAV